MIAYSVIVAVLIYLDPINAESTYTTDEVQLKAHLFEEINRLAKYRYHHPKDKPVSSYDPICDSRRVNIRESLCDKIMIHMINEKNEGVFKSFEKKASKLPKPQLADLFSDDPYTCQYVYVETYGFEKRMYWCPARQYKLKSGKKYDMQGFFCAAALGISQPTGYAFRPPEPDSDSVEPVGEICDSEMYNFPLPPR